MEAKINGIRVQGHGHLQPGVNQWIGIFEVPANLLEDEPEKWIKIVVKYEGPFDSKIGSTTGQGKAKIIHVKKTPKGEITISLQGIGKPKLLNDLDSKIKYGYNGNLAPWRK